MHGVSVRVHGRRSRAFARMNSSVTWAPTTPAPSVRTRTPWEASSGPTSVCAYRSTPPLQLWETRASQVSRQHDHRRGSSAVRPEHQCDMHDAREQAVHATRIRGHVFVCFTSVQISSQPEMAAWMHGKPVRKCTLRGRHPAGKPAAGDETHQHHADAETHARCAVSWRWHCCACRRVAVCGTPLPPQRTDGIEPNAACAWYKSAKHHQYHGSDDG